MTLPATLERVDQLQALLQPRPAATPATGFAQQLQGASATTAAASPAPTSSAFAQAAAGLGSSALVLPGGAAPTAAGPTAAALPGAGTAGQRALAAAQAEVGVAEQPPGSNDGPRIAQYRAATAGAGVGPWCAYFVSWAAQQAGTPLGEQGQGFGSVAAVADWAQRTGRSLPAGSTPQPGDLVVWGGSHIGMVESVGTDGSIHTVEGNSSDAVSRRTYGPDGGGATSYVRLG